MSTRTTKFYKLKMYNFEVPGLLLFVWLQFYLLSSIVHVNTSNLSFDKNIVLVSREKQIKAPSQSYIFPSDKSTFT